MSAGWLHWDWPGWSTLASVATLVAALAAVVTVFFTLRALKESREAAEDALAHAADQAQRDQYRSMLIEIATLILPSLHLPYTESRDRLRALVTVTPVAVAALSTVRATFNIGPRSFGPEAASPADAPEDELKERMLDEVARAIARINDKSFPVYISGEAGGAAHASGTLNVQ